MMSSSASTPGWSFETNDYRSLLNFRDRADCVRHAFDAALAVRLSRITLIHPDGTQETVTRGDFDNDHR